MEQGEKLVLTRQTEVVDSLGNVTSVNEEDYYVWVSTQDILRSDRQVHDMGLALPGTQRIFLFWSYPDSITENGTLVAEVGDLITDSEDIVWRIEEITGEREMEGAEIFKSALIKKVDLIQ